MYLTLWYIVLICHPNDACEHAICSVYVGKYGGLSESGLCVFRKVCPVDFFVVCKCSSVLLQSIIMSCIDCGVDDQWI